MTYEKNLRQLVNLTLRLVNDYRGDYKNGKSFTVAEVITAVNDAILELVISTGVLKNVSLIIPTEDVQVYTLPADCLRPIQLKFNGLEGTLLLPKQVSQYDYERDPISDVGDPVTFYRDKGLAYNQIGFVPIPGEDGSQAATASAGLLRRVSDGTDNLTYDANRALRRVTGAPIEYGGSGRIVRGLASNEGNIQVHYVRNPALMAKAKDYPDTDLPTWIHKDIKFGAGRRLLRGSRVKIHAIKGVVCTNKWQMLKFRLMELTQETGPLTAGRPA